MQFNAVHQVGIECKPIFIDINVENKKNIQTSFDKYFWLYKKISFS